jgi:hypothetical protein
VTAADHLLSWATPTRIKLLNGLAFDRLAGRSDGTLSRFFKRQNSFTMEKAGLLEYYPLLHHVGYLPPEAIWRPVAPLSGVELSLDLREWFTELRRALISRRAVDLLSERPVGVLNRYLNGEPHITFSRVSASLAAYQQVLRQLGYGCTDGISPSV